MYLSYMLAVYSARSLVLLCIIGLGATSEISAGCAQCRFSAKLASNSQTTGSRIQLIHQPWLGTVKIHTVAIEKDVVMLLGGKYDFQATDRKEEGSCSRHTVVRDTDFSLKNSKKPLGTWARHLSHIWCSDYSVCGGGATQGRGLEDNIDYKPCTTHTNATKKSRLKWLISVKNL